MRSLVVGGAGFVGQYLVRHLVEKGDDVVATGRAADLVGAVLPQAAQALALDITNAEACAEVIQKVKPEVVYHLAAISFVPEAEADFDKTLAVNVSGTSNVVRQCHLLGHLLGTKPTFVLISSAEVYGQILPGELPIREENPLRSMNNYSLSKRMAELVVERYDRSNTVRCVVARPFNHIGPGQDSRFVASNFALQLARIAHGHAAPVLQVGNLDARRDFSDVRDIVRAYRLLAKRGEGIYNLGAGVARSIQFILDTLVKIANIRVEIRRDPARMRGPEIPELYGSSERAQRDIGWVAEIPLERSLEEIYRYWHSKVAMEQAV
jgi:GDP-4-dehydro-6-deoxy-D-mannose reductase